MRPAGFEPTTSGLEICCSIQLSYGRFKEESAIAPFGRAPDATAAVDLFTGAIPGPQRNLFDGGGSLGDSERASVEDSGQFVRCGLERGGFGQDRVEFVRHKGFDEVMAVAGRAAPGPIGIHAEAAHSDGKRSGHRG